MTLPNSAIAAMLSDPLLPAEFAALCDCGGRRAGTASERAARDLLHGVGQAATGKPAAIVPAPYRGWRATQASLNLLEDGRRTPLAGLPLLRSAATPPGGIEADVLPVGRGTPEEFAALGGRLRGRFALVRHEYMFAAGHIHRRRKYGAALAAGAAGFLIAGPLPAGVVAGSSGRGEEAGIPAFGITPEAAARLSPVHGLARLHAVLHTDEAPAVTETMLFDIPGAEAGWIVLSAHLDGHDPAESALDNASGVAVALAVARALAPHAASFRRGLRLAFFSAEEWALTGSRVYLAGLTEAERAGIALNVNLDSVAGAGRLTALCSEFPAVGDFVRTASAAAGLPLGVHLPLMENSDHANFAAHGIPALRLVAGFDEPGSNLRHVLTAADTRDKATEAELRVAALAAAALTWEALTAPTEALAGLRG
jgi:aminopeptidase YwaD